MKFNRHLLLYPLVLSLPLIVTLSIAQQAEDEVPGIIPAEQDAIPESDVGYSAAIPEETGSASPPPTTRFSPTDKIHADDAVSFPVDI